MLNLILNTRALLKVSKCPAKHKNQKSNEDLEMGDWIFIDDRKDQDGNKFRRYAATNGNLATYVDDYRFEGAPLPEGGIVLRNDKVLAKIIKSLKIPRRDRYNMYTTIVDDDFKSQDIIISKPGEGDHIPERPIFERFLEAPKEDPKKFVMFAPQYLLILKV